MICQRCQKSLRSSEGVKCDECESRYHVKCVSNSKELEGGDRGYHWKCAVCQHPAGKSSSYTQVLQHTFNQVVEKIELVNKIQLPKLNSDLLVLKSTTDKIVKQNEEILNKIDELRKKDQRKVPPEACRGNGPFHTYRRRPLSLTKKSIAIAENSDEAPMLSSFDKYPRYTTRRRSYPLHKVFLLLNRKLYRTRTPQNKSPR